MYVLITTMLVMAGCSGKATKKTELEKEGLKGKAKSVEQFVYSATETDGKIQKGELLQSNIKRYDEKGNLTEDDLYHRNVYVYDENSRLIEEYWYNADDSLIAKLTYEYVYGVNGRLEEAKSATKLGDFNSYTYHYNSEGILVIKNTYGYNIHGIIYKSCQEIFDEAGNVIEKSNYTETGNLSSFDTYKYDKKGNEIGHTYKGALFGSAEWIVKYDRDGNQIESRYLDIVESKNTYKYKYDEKGSWIEQITYKSSEGAAKEASRITERIITYYE